jgi:hypothetical protein
MHDRKEHDHPEADATGESCAIHFASSQIRRRRSQQELTLPQHHD